MRLIRLALLIGLIGAGRITYAQAGETKAQASVQPAFDTVSIRPMKEDDKTPTHISNSVRNGYFRAVNVNVKALMEVAYDIPDTRMFGGPSWLTAEKFSIEAKTGPEVDAQIGSLSSDEAKQLKRKMLVTLLVDRFKLVVHIETKEMPVYAILVGKGGQRSGEAVPDSDSIPPGNDRIAIRAGYDSLEILAYELSWRLGRPVLNQTGLHDRKALTLRWQDDETTAADTNAPSLATALQEQLGLKLQATRGSVPVLQVDHAERPSDN